TDYVGNPAAFGLDASKYISLTPLYYGGLQNSISFKSLHIDFLFQYVRQWGTRQFEFWNGEFGPGYAERGIGNQPVTVLDRWQKPGDNALHAPFSAAVNSVYRTQLTNLSNSDVFYTLNASYVRLKNVSLSWDLPSTFLKKLQLQSGRLYTQGQNLFTMTHYAGLDPETGSITTLPPLRTWTVGIQIVL
ncbi:MAG: hypothetical protein J7497_07710, partial [Chitinophagaceae bacterium]|nr:hypothetical protein [Chitinophagaceae bacterium]